MTMSHQNLRPRLRAGIASALTLPLVAVLATGAGAADDDLTIENLPHVSDSQVASHRVAIDVPAIVAIDVPEIHTFEPEVETEGGETVVSLDTDVLFRFGEADLTPSATRAIVNYVQTVPTGAAVTVVGHTDSVGSKQSNQKLSRDRAVAVAAAIAQERADLDLTVEGKGESDPVAANTKGGEDNPEGRMQNRRVEIRYAG